MELIVFLTVLIAAWYFVSKNKKEKVYQIARLNFNFDSSIPIKEQKKRIEKFNKIQKTFYSSQEALLRAKDYQGVIDAVEYYGLDYYEYLAQKAQALHSLNRLKEAYSAYEKCISLSTSKYQKDNYSVELSEIDFDQDNFEKCIERIQSLDSDYIKDHDYGHFIKERLGMSFEKLGKPELAINAYKMAPLGSKSPDKDVIRLMERAADCYVLIGKKTQAKNLYEKILSFEYSGRVNSKLEKLMD